METTSRRINCFNLRHFLRSFKKACRIRRDSIKSVKGASLETRNKQACDNYDYVGEEPDKASSDSNSLYQCEMPVERIKKLKAQRDSMSRLEGLPLGVKSCFPTVDKRYISFLALKLWIGVLLIFAVNQSMWSNSLSPSPRDQFWSQPRCSTGVVMGLVTAYRTTTLTWRILRTLTISCISGIEMVL